MGAPTARCALAPSRAPGPPPQWPTTIMSRTASSAPDREAVTARLESAAAHQDTLDLRATARLSPTTAVDTVSARHRSSSPMTTATTLITVLSPTSLPSLTPPRIAPTAQERQTLEPSMTLHGTLPGLLAAS